MQNLQLQPDAPGRSRLGRFWGSQTTSVRTLVGFSAWPRRTWKVCGTAKPHEAQTRVVGRRVDVRLTHPWGGAMTR